VAFALDTFGDRWTLIVIRDMALRGFTTYGELLSCREGIATNVLADRLRQLEADGIIHKSPDPEHHRSHRYTLTDKGCDLLPVLFEMIRWSAKHDPHTNVGPKTLDRIENHRDEFIAEIRARSGLA